LVQKLLVADIRMSGLDITKFLSRHVKQGK